MTDIAIIGARFVLFISFSLLHMGTLSSVEDFSVELSKVIMPPDVTVLELVGIIASSCLVLLQAESVIREKRLKLVLLRCKCFFYVTFYALFILSQMLKIADYLYILMCGF